MEYIVLDLEWNTAYFKPQNRFINEIIQIGAVKLDESFNIVDTFQVLVRSAISKKLSKRITELTGITTEEMLMGISFIDAVTQYNEWVGDDSVTMTWSDSDLYAIADNSNAFLNGTLSFKITKYIDLQSYIQNEIRITGQALTNQISLSNAANLLNVSYEGLDLHTAIDDARLAALVLKHTFNVNRFNALVRDTTDPTFYKRLFFKPYYITKIGDSRINKSYLKFTCRDCQNKLIRQNKWRFKNNWFRAEFMCPACERTFRCMLSCKQTYDKLVVKKRILPVANNDEAVNNVNALHELPEKL